MLMKRLVKQLEPQGFEVEVTNYIVKHTNTTTLRKHWLDRGYAISIVAFADGGFMVKKYIITEYCGKICAANHPPIAEKYFEKNKDLMANIHQLLDVWTTN